MKDLTPPCKNCEKRKLYCHSKCTDYTTWKEEWKADKVAYRKDKDADKQINEYTSASIEKQKKSERRRKS